MSGGDGSPSANCLCPHIFCLIHANFHKTITITVPPTAWAVIVSGFAAKKRYFWLWVPFSKAASPLRSRTHFRVRFWALRARTILHLSALSLWFLSDLYSECDIKSTAQLQLLIAGQTLFCNSFCRFPNIDIKFVTNN